VQIYDQTKGVIEIKCALFLSVLFSTGLSSTIFVFCVDDKLDQQLPSFAFHSLGAVCFRGLKITAKIAAVFCSWTPIADFTANLLCKKWFTSLIQKS